jgi:hypothetical protein
MTELKLRSWILWCAFAMVALASCSGERSAVVPERTSVSGPDGYATLPQWSLKLTSDACASLDFEFCTAAVAVKARWGPDSVLLVSVNVGRKPQIYTVNLRANRATAVGFEGGGPGEYRAINSVALSSNGDVLVFDALQRRILRYAVDGRLVSMSQVPMPAGFIEAAFVQERLVAVGFQPPRQAGDSMPVQIFALDSGKQEPSLLATLPLRLPAYRMGDMIPPRGAFEATSIWAFREDGRIIYTSGNELELAVFDGAGIYELRYGFEVQAREVTDSERAQAARSNVRVGNARMQQAIDAASQASVHLGAARHPSITAIVVSTEGDIWMRESVRASGDSVHWVVSSAQFEPRGRVLLGANDRVLAVRADHIWITDQGSRDFDLRAFALAGGGTP